MLNAQKERHELNRIIDLRKTVHDDTSAWSSSGHPHSAQRPLDSHAIAFITAVKDETQYCVCLKHLDALQIPSGYTVERVAVLGGVPYPSVTSERWRRRRRVTSYTYMWIRTSSIES